MMTHGNYLPNLANYTYKYLRGDQSMSGTGLKPRKEKGFCIRKYECAQQTQSPKNKAKIMKGGVLTSTGTSAFLDSVTVFLRPLSPCDLACAESQLGACATSFCPSPLCHKHHSAKWVPDIHCSDHIGCCVAQLFHLPHSVFSRSLRSVFHMLVASMVLFPVPSGLQSNRL
jgi:hypothetical protein